MTHLYPRPPEIVKASGLYFVSITEPADTVGGGRPKYSVSVPWQDLSPELAMIMNKQVSYAQSSTWGIVNFTSLQSPRIYGLAEDNSDMIALHQRCMATNVSLGSVLRGMPGELFISFYEGKGGTYDGQIMPALNCIRVDPSKAKFLAFDELYESRGDTA